MDLNASIALGLFGGTSSGSAGSGDAASAIRALKNAEKPANAAKGIAQEKKDPVSITALKQFQTAIAHAKDIKTALMDPRVLNVLLPAMGLADQIGAPGLVRTALLADPNDPKSVLKTLDPRFKAAAKSLDLKHKGLAALKDPQMQQTLTEGYLQYQYQIGLDQTNPGVSDALYFVKNAASLGTNIYNILGNAVLRRVVSSALNLPAQIAIQPVETQAKQITTRLNLKDLQDPKKVERIAEQYVINQVGSATGSGAGAYQLSLLA